MRKRSISLKWGAVLIALNTLLATTAYGADAGQELPFIDISGLEPAKAASILQAAQKGLITGDPGGSFRPADTISRQELAVLLVKALQLESAPAGGAVFRDVSESGWSASAINAVRDAGLMTGDGNGRFNPTAPVSREEMAAIFVRAVGAGSAKGGQAVQIADQANVSQWAKQYAEAALRLQLIDVSGDKLNPKGNVKREDIAGLLLDIFKSEQRTAVINSVDGDVVTIDGTPFLIEGKLKELIGDTNREALKGAILKFDSLNRHVDGLRELEIVQNNAVLQAAGLPANAVLSVSGNSVHIQGPVAGELQVNSGASTIIIEGGKVNHLVIETATPVVIQGSSSVTTLAITNAGAKVTLDGSMLIQTLQLPDNVLPSSLIQNYSIVQKNITQVQTASGTPVATTAPVIVTAPQPTVQPTPAPVTTPTPTATPTPAPTAEPTQEPGPVDPTPVDPTPVDPTPVDPTPVDPTPVDPTPVDPTPVDPTPVNHAPTVAGSLNDISKLVGDGVQSVDLAGLFADVDNDSLTLTAVSSDTGVATVSITDGVLKVSPLNAGTTTITVTADDGRGGTIDTTLTATFTVPVNHTPTVAGTLSNISKLVGDGVQSVDLAGVFADEDNDSLTLTAVSSDTGVATVSINDGVLKVSPVNAGTATITITAEDGRGGTIDTTLTATFTVPVNHAPTVDTSLNDISKLVGDGVQSVNLAGLFTDEDNDSLTLTAVSSDTGVATVSITDGLLKVSPVNAGTATITVTAEDGRGGSIDTTLTATFTVPLNHAPTVANSLSNISKLVGDGAQSVDLDEIFADEDNDSLTLTAVSSDTGVATVSITDGVLKVSPLNAGTTTITITAEDGRGGSIDTTLTATFTVPVNHAPTVAGSLNDISKLVGDGVQSINLDEIFADEDNDSLTLTAVSSDTGIATVSITDGVLKVSPLNAGTTTITITAEDGRGGSIDTTLTATFTVPVNHAPTVAGSLNDISKLVGDGVQSINLDEVFADEDNDSLTLTAVSSDTGVATVSITDGVLKVSPLNAGTTTITITAEDGRGGTIDTTLTATFTVPVNHAPTVAGSLNDISKLVGDGVQSVDLAGVFTDEDNDSLTLTAVSSDTGVATVSITDGVLKVSPLNAGTTTISITAEDGRGGTIDTTLTATFTVPVNHAPTVATSLNDIISLITEGVQSLNLAGIFSDEDNDELTLTAVSSNPGVAAVTVDDDILKVTPLNAGITTITVTAQDGRGGTISTTLTATFTVNNAPGATRTLSNINTLVTDGVQNVDIIGLFDDMDNDPLTVTAVSSDPGVATVTISEGILKVNPVNAGTTTITITANDGRGGIAQTTFNVTLEAAPQGASGLFFSETVYGEEFALQALELYNPTDSQIDGSAITIKRSDGGDDIVLNNGTISSHSTFVIIDGYYGGVVPDNYYQATMMFFLDDQNPVQLSLYVNDVLVDTCVIIPYQTLARVSTTTKGSTVYDASEWNEMPSNDSSGLGKFGITEIEAP